MANFRLDLNDDFTSEILSLYLWGQKRAPSKDEITNYKTYNSYFKFFKKL
ncbi:MULTISPECIES: hypothetical protein [unclassified Campylobacter]|nr:MULTISPECIES: hypothetical protein [unclassified Campylobacter]MBZ7978269.1 hypothetical protein [Campylobacter sp. RM12654]MBZ7984517.1 hypothetical protein [Campylobacter sp. RM12647]MBZ7991280.1 hypothetical protein [Campylobacter sp. RM9331]MBZ8005806.1 hypothetical protein [Campylobacter sp. RM9332]MBZ8007639.1 hypothetical protein [Campylobacter sp. RM9334]